MKLVDKNNKNYQTMSSEVLMVIDRKGKKRERYFNHLKKYKNKLTKSLIKFYLPSTVKGTSLLTHSQDGADDNLQWIYLPALRSLQQIKGDKGKESFMGSDFTYADVAGRQISQDRHSLVKEDDKYYYIRSIPKKGDDLYSKINLLIDKEINVPLRVVFYNKKGEKIKTLKNDENKIKKLGSLYMITESIMINHKVEGSTKLMVSNIKLNPPISDHDVGIKGLK